MGLDVYSVDSIEATNRNQWNHIVEHADLGSVYHRYEWLRAIENATSYEPAHLFVSKNGNPVGIFPNIIKDSEQLPVRHLASPTPGPTGPIATTDEEEVLRLLLEAVPEVRDRTTISHEIQTSGTEFSRYHELFQEYGYQQRFDFCEFILDITRDWEEILADMDSSRRRAIRKGHDQEFEVVDREITKESMAEFYEAFSSVMDRVDGNMHPRQFFVELAEMPDRMKLLTLRVDGADRGTILLTLDDERSTVHYEFSGITEQDFEYHPSELLHEHAIEWAQDNGYDRYNFGGTAGDFRDGVFHFKVTFGARPVPALAWERGFSSPTWLAYKAGRWAYWNYVDSGQAEG